MEEEITEEHIDLTEKIETITEEKKVEKLNYIKYFINSVTKPYDVYNENIDKIDNIKVIGIISGVIVVLFTLLRLFKNILNTIRVRNYWNNEVVVKWSNISNINFIKVIGLGLLFYIVLLGIISGVYFLASLVIKKDIKYQKMLLIACISVIPFLLSYIVLLPLFSIIHTALGIIVLIFGISYSLVILFTLSNDLIKITDKNKRIYFNVICISIILLLSLFLIYEIDLKILIEDIKLISNFLK